MDKKTSEKTRKNLQKGFIAPVLLVIIALLVMGGGFYVYENKKTEAPVVVDTGTEQTNTQTPSVTNQENSTNNKPINVDPQSKSIASGLFIIKPVISETWQIGTSHTIQWKLNLDLNALRGTLFLTVFLQDSLGNLINTQAGQTIQRDQTTTIISIPYFDPAIVPGNYHIVLNIHDTIPALPCVGCQGYSKLVASATSTSIITLTASDGKVKPVILSLDVTSGRVGDTIPVNGVVFQPDSKVIFERLNPLDGQARIKISVMPQIISSTKLTFTIPNTCTNSDVCSPQNSSVTPGLYYVSVQTQYGTSNVSGIQIIN